MTESTTVGRPRLDMDQVRAWYEAGDSLRGLERRTGVPHKTIQRHMIAAGIPRRDPGPVIPIQHVRARNYQRSSMPERQQIYAAIEAGVALEIIAERSGRSLETIRRYARRPGARNSPPRRRAREEEAVREWHARGLRGSQIDVRLGWWNGKAGQIQKRLGLDWRQPGPDPAEAAGLYRSLGSVEAVAARMGVGRPRAAAALRAAGVRLIPGGHRQELPLDAHLDELRRARTVERVPVGVLADRYGVSYGYMNFYLTSRGIRGYRLRTAAEHQRMLELAADGMFHSEIARRIGTTPQTVAQHLKNPGGGPRLRP